ncbi:MAG: hypothetical protein COA41_15380 [Sphingopyxis sp.]|nr:MAG: hypothetical protein COA41_15380 [Sphingopyxis sp.]
MVGGWHSGYTPVHGPVRLLAPLRLGARFFNAWMAQLELASACELAILLTYEANMLKKDGLI